MKEKSIFWVRMIAWILIGCVAPIVTFAVKFGLFHSSPPEVDALGNVIVKENISLNGWGIVCCLLVGSYVLQILKELAKAHKGFSITQQCVTGLVKLVPYAIVYGVCYFLSGVITEVMFCLAVLIICKLIAIPLNPLPKWRYDKLQEEDYSDLLDNLTVFVKKILKKGGEP